MTSNTGVPRIVEMGRDRVILSLGTTYHGGVKDHTVLDQELLVTLDMATLARLEDALAEHKAAELAQEAIDRHMQKLGEQIIDLNIEVDEDSDPEEVLQRVMVLIGLKAVQ